MCMWWNGTIFSHVISALFYKQLLENLIYVTCTVATFILRHCHSICKGLDVIAWKTLPSNISFFFYGVRKIYWWFSDLCWRCHERQCLNLPTDNMSWRPSRIAAASTHENKLQLAHASSHTGYRQRRLSPSPYLLCWYSPLVSSSTFVTSARAHSPPSSFSFSCIVSFSLPVLFGTCEVDLCLIIYGKIEWTHGGIWFYPNRLLCPQ